MSEYLTDKEQGFKTAHCEKCHKRDMRILKQDIDNSIWLYCIECGHTVPIQNIIPNNKVN